MKYQVCPKCKRKGVKNTNGRIYRYNECRYCKYQYDSEKWDYKDTTFKPFHFKRVNGTEILPKKAR